MFIFLIALASASALPAGIWPTAGMTQSGTPFSVPQWTSLRIRMDDTLTSEYSMEGDPFSVDVEGAIESGGRGKNTFIHTGIGAGAGALLGGIFGGGRGAARASARLSVAWQAWEVPGSADRR